jgi:hypothetical protein
MNLDAALDVFTLRVAGAAVVVVMSIPFLVQAWDRRGELVDPLRMLALSASLATALGCRPCSEPRSRVPSVLGPFAARHEMGTSHHRPAARLLASLSAR